MITFNIYNYPNHSLTYSAKQLKIYSNRFIDLDIKNQLIAWDVAFADKIIVAYENDRLIGFFRYDLGDYKHNLYEAGTYVIPEYRKYGLGFSLWDKVFQLEKPELVYGHIESIDGYFLYNKIKRTYPNVKYDFSMAANVLDNIAISA